MLFSFYLVEKIFNILTSDCATLEGCVAVLWIRESVEPKFFWASLSGSVIIFPGSGSGSFNRQAKKLKKP
jgi:hypothetical protein